MSIILLSLIIVGVIWHGWVLMWLWQWFMVPIFNLLPLHLVEAIGIALIVGFLAHEHDIKKEKEEDKEEMLIRRTLNLFVMPLFAFIFGWVIHLFM